MRWIERWIGTAAPEPKPQLAPGERIFAVGDIHGRSDLLELLLLRIAAYIQRAPDAKNTLIFLGDYVDRGPDTRGVIERLSRLNISGSTTIYLRGNHDQAILDFLDDDTYQNAILKKTAVLVA